MNREDDIMLLAMALLCRLGESVTLTNEEIEDLRRGDYGIEWVTTGDSFNNDTFNIQLSGGPR